MSCKNVDICETDRKKFNNRYVYNSKYKHRDIECQMVRPLKYSLMLGRMVLNDVSKRSYADVVAGKVNKTVSEGP